MKRYAKYEEGYALHKKDVLEDVSAEIYNVFGAHIPPIFRRIKIFFDKELNGYSVVIKKKVEGEYLDEKRKYGDFLFEKGRFGGSTLCDDCLADIIEYRTSVEEDQNITGIFGPARKYLDSVVMMKYLSEYVQTLEILRSPKEYGFIDEEISIRPPTKEEI